MEATLKYPRRTRERRANRPKTLILTNQVNALLVSWSRPRRRDEAGPLLIGISTQELRISVYEQFPQGRSRRIRSTSCSNYRTRNVTIVNGMPSNRIIIIYPTSLRIFQVQTQWCDVTALAAKLKPDGCWAPRPRLSPSGTRVERLYRSVHRTPYGGRSSSTPAASPRRHSSHIQRREYFSHSYVL
jgi:hypothetical protein